MRKIVHLRTHFALVTALMTPAFAADAPNAATPANVYVQHNLVSDVPGLADVTDKSLVNPWGMSTSAASPFWVSNAGAGNSTLYNGSGAITPLIVTIPAGKASSGAGKPSGQVNNNTAGFILANGTKASFIFDTLDGTISAWNGGGAALLMVDNSAAGASYTGLAIGSNSSGPLLYAANFRAGTIDVFDGKFASTKAAGGFLDPNLPADYAPFNIWNLGGKLYVMYAKQNASKTFDSPGAGNGFVDVYDTDGNLLQRLISNGPLNSPWGVAIAPANFGVFSNDLLVGNFGDGTINAFDPKTGASLGALQDSTGKPIVNAGLWALLVGNGGSGGDRNTLYFTAGINGEKDGLLGAIAPPSGVLSILNGASNATGTIAPGEVVVLTGNTIGPSPLAAAKLPLTGAVDTTLSGTTVTFNGIQAPILYASASQTAVVVPFGINGSATANVVVTYKGQPTAAFPVQVAAAAPGLFTSDTTGSGQVVAINQDGTLNSSKSPVATGQAVLIFATGLGMMTPISADGTITSGEFFEVASQTPTLTIGGQNAKVLYAGSVPGDVQGVLEIEAIVPSGVASGNAAVVLSSGTLNSQSGVTLAVK